MNDVIDIARAASANIEASLSGTGRLASVRCQAALIMNMSSTPMPEMDISTVNHECVQVQY